MTTKRSRMVPIACSLFVIGLFLLSCLQTGVSIPLLIRRGNHFTDIVSAMFPPDSGFIRTILPLLWATIQMSITGTVIGSLLALLAAPLCATVIPGNSIAKKLFRAVIQILRAFPALILALFATFLFGLSSFSGTVAIGVYTFAILTRLTYEDLENAPIGPFLAMQAMGIRQFPAYCRALVPEIATSYLTNVLYLLEANVRHSAILGYVGAGGIGLLLNEKVAWREYNKVGMILILLFVTVWILEQLGTLITQVIQGERQIRPGTKRFLIAAFVLLFLYSTITLQGPDFSHTSTAMLKKMAYGITHPDWSLFLGTGSDSIGYLLVETVCIAFAGTLIGAFLAVLLVFWNSRRIVPAPVAWVMRTVIAAIRSVPFLIYGLILIRVTGPGSFAGVLTLAMCSVGLLCKRFTQAIDAMDLRAVQALSAMGTPPLPRLTRGMLPQLYAPFASAVLYRFDVNIREASVLGLVGAGGIGAPLIFAMNQYAWDKAAAISIGLVLLSWIVDFLSGKIRKKLK